MSSSSAARPLPNRTVAFDYPDDLAMAWNRPYPEMACAANAISLLMPYIEPYFARSIRAVIDQLDDPLRARTEDYLRQELAHQRQHRRFNDLLVAQHPGLNRLERLARWTFLGMTRRLSPRFNVAVVAAAESAAFGIARWIDLHVDELFDQADPVVSTLFLWHLAEEIEHKSAAFEVYEAVDGSRLRLAAASTLILAIVIPFIIVATVAMLWSQRRLRYPVTWFRLTRWAISMAFTLLPTVAGSLIPSHHPDQLADPPFLAQLLGSIDPATGTMPLWRHDDPPDVAGPSTTVHPPP
jgi:predicted metal-dependent hydrolase